MNNVDLKTINVELLKNQKSHLVQLALEVDHRKPFREALDGVINLLDYIQDAIELEPEKFNHVYHKVPLGLKFICPACKCTTLEEVISLDIAINPITRLDREGDHDYGPMHVESDTEVLEYQCVICGWVPPKDLPDEEVIRDCVSLADWLKEQPYNKKQRKGKQ